jgi:hypothetical protein
MNRIGKLRTSRPGAAAQRVSRKWTLAPLLAALLGTGAAHAQAATSASPTPQFDILGFIQAATLDTGTMCPGVAPTLRGGTVTVNGNLIIVPCNTILQMPAPTVVWSQLFEPTFIAPIGTGVVGLNGKATIPAGQTGLAIADKAADFTIPGAGGALIPTPFPSFEIRIVGNIIKDATGNDQYIAGLILPISQQGLNAGAGKVTCIDYTTGTLYVGGTNLAAGTTACTAANGTRLILNDPIGRDGLKHSPDQRFAVDVNNTTIHAGTGYPMCIPRVAPPAVDALCPIKNRPLNGDARFNIPPGAPLGTPSIPDRFLAIGAPLRIFTMLPPPGQVGADPSGFPDARQQAPIMIGDFLTWSGTLAKDSTGTTQSLTGQYVSVNTIVDNVAIFTAKGTVPAYVSVEEALLGTGGTPEFGIIEEATTRIFITGFTTDPSVLIDINAVDVNPCTGAETLRLLGTLDPASQPTLGRFRFHVLGGTFMPPTREMIAVSHNGTTPASLPGGSGFANGLGSGQYRLPNFNFIFAENVRLGEPIISNNFQDFPFLTLGSGPFIAGPTTTPVTATVGQLIPWPGTPVPAKAFCSATGNGTAPLVSAGIDFAVGPSRVEQLAGSVIQDPNGGALTITTTQTAGTAVVLTNANTVTPTFTSPAVAAGASTVLTFKITATDTFGTTSATVNVTVFGTVRDTLTAGEAKIIFPTTAGQGSIGSTCGVGTLPACGAGFVHKVGDKGGRMNVGVTESIPNPAISILAVGYGFMEIDPVNGLPGYTISVTGQGFAAPATVLVRSSLGAELLIPTVIK